MLTVNEVNELFSLDLPPNVMILFAEQLTADSWSNDLLVWKEDNKFYVFDDTGDIREVSQEDAEYQIAEFKKLIVED